MAEELIPFQQAALEKLSKLHEKAGDYIRQATADNTRRGYLSDWTDFDNWCAEHSLQSLPAAPATVAHYLTARADTLKVSSLQRRLAAIVKYHKVANYPDPTKAEEVKACWRGIRRDKGIATTQKAPAIIDIIRELVSVLPDSLLGCRDRALLLVGFAGAFRRSELVSLNVDDLIFDRNGLTITLRRSKTDQEGAGRKVGILYGSNLATCPVRSMQDWMVQADIKAGAAFRSINRHGQVSLDRLSSQSVALVVKKYAELSGLDPALYAGHSLRAGLVTSAEIAGVSERAIMNQTGHRNTEMVRRYIRDADIFRDNPTGKIGL